MKKLDGIELVENSKTYIIWYEGRQYKVITKTTRNENKYIRIRYIGQVSTHKLTYKLHEEIKEVVKEYLKQKELS